MIVCSTDASPFTATRNCNCFDIGWKVNNIQWLCHRNQTGCSIYRLSGHGRPPACLPHCWAVAMAAAANRESNNTVHIYRLNLLHFIVRDFWLQNVVEDQLLNL
ncbi:hypothetical protein ACOSP7_014786 [Xanthoceras sorbifolium]